MSKDKLEPELQIVEIDKQESKLDKLKDLINKLQDLRTYQSPQLYMAFTANNYRLVADKADGARTLAVAIKWSHQNGKLHPTFIFDEPLTYKGETHMQPHIKSALFSLNANNFSTLNISNIYP